MYILHASVCRNISFITYLNILGLGLLLSSPSIAENTQPDFQDWILLPPNCSLCAGKYKENNFNNHPNHLNTEFQIEAQQAQLLGLEALMKGEVFATHGKSQLKADEARVIQNETKTIEKITAKGHVDFSEPGFRVLGDFAEFKPQAKTKQIKNAHYRLYTRHARGQAQEINTYVSNKQEDKANLRQATYSTCAPGQNTWTLKANTVILNKTSGRGQAQHAKFYLFDTPVFYWPYLDFPLDDRRTSGFLFPSFASSKQHGLEWIIPYYWNIAPNYDATLSWHSYSKRNQGLDLETRYLQKNWAGQFNLEYLPNDRLYKRYVADKKADPQGIAKNDPRYQGLKGQNRYFLLWKHQGTWQESSIPGQLGLNLTFNKASDSNYLQDFNSDLASSNTQQLLQQAKFNHGLDTWNTQVNFQQYQTLHPFEGARTDSVYRLSPQISSKASFGEDLVLQTPIEWSNFTRRHSYYTNQPYTTGQRINFRPSLSWQAWQRPGWFIKPRVQLDFTSYDLSLDQSAQSLNKPTSPQRFLPILDLDSGLVFEREIQFKRPYLQTLEPRLYGLWVPYKDQNNLPIFDTGLSSFDYNLLYRDNRFAGWDRLGDTKQITLGLGSRFINRSTGFEKAHLELGEIFYFNHRQVTLCDSKANPNCIFNEQPDHKEKFSNLAGLAALNIREDLSSRANLEFSRKDKVVEKSGFYVHYHPSYDDLLTAYIGYQYFRKDPNQGIDPFTQNYRALKQIDTALSLPLNIHWRVLGRVQYNIAQKYTQNLLWALEHQGCCTAI
ncbi:MAG: LPS-assembly protein LptD, partial [Gammaproteobacteria bacterium]